MPAPEDVKFVGISPVHVDHSGQLAPLKNAMLLIAKGDRDAINATPPIAGANVKGFSEWIAGKRKVEALTADEDIFGDGAGAAGRRNCGAEHSAIRYARPRPLSCGPDLPPRASGSNLRASVRADAGPDGRPALHSHASTRTDLPFMIAERDNPMFASSLANGLSVLRAFSADEPGLTNAALAHRTGLSRATISRLTFTLCETGLLYYDSTDRQYRIGPGAVSLAYPFMLHLRIQHVALPMMQAFADRHRTTVSLGMRSGENMIYIDSCRSFEGSQFRADAGASLPILRTAMGRAWLAAQPPYERRLICDELRRQRAAQWRKYAPALKASISSIAQRGYCINTGDLHADLQAVAVPLSVPVAGRTVVLNTGLPTELVRAGVLERLGEALARLARKVESAWSQDG